MSVNGKDVGRIELVQKRMAVARGLCEAQVEAAAAGAGDMRHHAVEHLAVPLVFVEPVVEIGSQEASALRDAERDRALNRAGRNRQGHRRTAYFRCDDRIADRRRSRADHRRILRLVDDLVNLRRLKAAGQITRVGPAGSIQRAISIRSSG